jgi:hypothetical protein
MVVLSVTSEVSEMESDTNKIMVQLRAAHRRVDAALQRREDLCASALKAITKELKHVREHGCDDFRGTHYRSDTGKWIAKIKNKSQTFQIGSYESQSEAAIARMIAEMRIAMNEEPVAIRPKSLSSWIGMTLADVQVRFPSLGNYR